ncbi:hypothetical protein [Mammaliicoccus sp. P-M59]|uniref:hypothetical protein n=1 Tax=Mammaliicoccus sp. P-M59 TaxID=2898718 RepID=UPI001EFC21D5|nr:hypothetical protein [Mammaliicoccus sp. P-M59]
MVINRKNILTDNDIITMRNSIFNKNSEGLKYDPYIKIPNSFMEKIIDEDMSSNWKGQVILTYIGCIIAYVEAVKTYRKFHMSVDDIMSFMGVNANNQKVRKAFSKNSWITQHEYVKNVNMLPHSYEVNDNSEFIFKTTNDMTKDEVNMHFANMDNRQVRCMEPLRHTQGVKRKRGRGYQVIEVPLLHPDATNYITLKYSTILDFIDGKTTATDFYLLCVLKYITKDGFLTRLKPFQTSYKRLGTLSKLSTNTVMTSFQLLIQLYPSAIKYNSYIQLIKGEFKTKSELRVVEYCI